jgi:hypothetical protein
LHVGAKCGSYFPHLPAARTLLVNGDPTARDKSGQRIRPPLERISDVIGMGRKRIFGFSGMGPKARAELEAFLASRGLTWSDDPAPGYPGYNVPAGQLGDDWNIIDSPTGKHRLALTTDNMRVRSQYWSLYRGFSNLQDLLCEAAGERNHFNRALNKLFDDMNELWLALANNQIVLDDASCRRIAHTPRPRWATDRVLVCCIHCS